MMSLSQPDDVPLEFLGINNFYAAKRGVFGCLKQNEVKRLRSGLLSNSLEEAQKKVQMIDPPSFFFDLDFEV